MTNKSFMKIFMAAIICLGLSLTQVLAQAGSGGISGTVSDANGAVVPNAAVKLVSTDTGLTKNTTSNGEGVYSFVSLQPGKYKVTVTAASFAEQSQEVEVQVGRTTDAFFVMGASGVTAEVTVSAESIQTTQSNSDAVLSEAAISNLPINGRKFQDFATLTPSAQVDPQRGQISLAGQRGINGNINVDGVDFNQPFFGGIRGGERSNQAFTLPQSSIKEFQVVAAGYSAEYGRSSGGVINVVTQSGTNNIRGSAFYLFRPQKLARNNEFVDEIERQRLVARGLTSTPAPNQHQFGGAVGGPIVKNKLFFFGSYEQQKFKAPRYVLFGNLGTVVRDAGATTTNNAEAFDFYTGLQTEFTQTNDAYAGLAKMDWQINDQNRFNIRYNYSKNNALNAVSTGETAFDPTTNRDLTGNGTEKNRNYSFVSQLATVFGSSVSNEMRFQFAREDRPRLANGIAANIQTGLGFTGTRNFMPTTQYDRRVQITEALTYITGNHTMKFGGEFSHIFADQLFGFNQFGSYNPGGGGNNTQLQVLSLTPGLSTDRRFDVTGASLLQQIGNLSAAYAVRELAFFAQDQWKARPNFTINFGLRAEQQYNPSPELGNSALISAVQNAQFPIRGNRGFDPTQIQDSGWQWGPRLGFSWDPSENGKTVIRGFSGLYYARTPMLLLAAPFNNFRSPAGDLSLRLPFALPSTLTAGAPMGAFITANPTYAGIMGLTSAFCSVAANFNACAPNTVYRQLAVIGINLNSSPLSNLPRISGAQAQQIAGLINPGINPLLAGLQPIGMDENFKNPRSFQFGGGAEHEAMKNLVVGIDYLQVKTDFLQRNRDINIPGPVSLEDYLRANNSAAVFAAIDPSVYASGRPYFGLVRGAGIPTTTSAGAVNVPLRGRPLAALGSVQVRESSAKSLYRALTLRARYVGKRANINAYYTLSSNKSDDDNERDAGGIGYDNSFDLRPEYGFARLDRTHQFVANPVFFLPLGFEVSSAMRFRSGIPIDAVANSDLNGDTLFNDRPFYTTGVPFSRNGFRNNNVFDFDLRAQKGFKFDERKRLIFSVEMFNVLNLENMQFAGTAVTQYCSPSNIRCGLDGVTNINFLQRRDQNPTSANVGRLLLNNNPGSQVFQMQLGARFQF
jgi:hypothetical protein